MKKIVSLLLVAMMLIGMMGALAGCNNGGNKVAPDFVMPEGGFDTTKEVTITFYHQMGAQLQEILNTAIADFKVYATFHFKSMFFRDILHLRQCIIVMTVSVCSSQNARCSVSC